MGFLDKLKNIFSGFFYIVDDKALSDYVEKEIAETRKIEIDIVTDFNIYINGTKNRILICNHEFTYEGEDVGKGIVYYFGEKQTPYNSLKELLDAECYLRTPFYKIELNLSDSGFLNEFMKSHPELSVEDY